MASETPAAFAPRPDDDDDVRWALSTALVQWNRGGKADAVVWLRRASEAADASGAPARAEELRRYAASLAENLWSQPPDDIDVVVDVESGDQRAPLPPPPAAVRAIRQRSMPPAPPSPSFAPHNTERQSLVDLEPVREHYASAPEIVLEEEALDASELEEILDYVGDDELELVDEVPSRTSSAQAVVDFSDRLSTASVEPMSVDAVLPSQGSFDSDPGELDPSEDRVSKNDAFDLRPSHRGPAAPEARAPAVALPPEDDEFDERVTMVPLVGGSGQSSLEVEPVSAPAPREPAVPRAAPVPDLAVDSEPTELLDGETALGIDADLRDTYNPESIDLGADWAPMQSDRAPEHTVPGRFADDVGAVAIEAEIAPETLGAELVTDAAPNQPSPSQEPSPPSYSAELIPLPSDPGDLAGIEPASALAEEAAVFAPRSAPQQRAAQVPASAPGADAIELAPASAPREASAELTPASLPPESLPALEFASEPPGPARTEGAFRASAPPPTLASSGRIEGTNIDGVDLMTTRGFEDLPEDVQEHLAQLARVETLNEGEEVGLFGAAVITNGQVNVMPAFTDEAGAVALQSDVVFTQGTLSDSIALRVVAKVDGTRVAVWDPKPLEEAIEACPWVHDELRFIADRFLAVCGATLGPLGERLDESLRSAVFDRLEVRTFAAGEELATEGQPPPGLFVIGGGRVEVLSKGGVSEELNPGDFLFATAIMGGGKCPGTARAGASGALTLFAPRSVAHELMISVPPLLEVLAG